MSKATIATHRRALPRRIFRVLQHVVLISAVFVSSGGMPSAAVLARTTAASFGDPARAPRVNTAYGPAAPVPGASEPSSAPMLPGDGLPLNPVLSHPAPVPVPEASTVAPLLPRTLDAASQPMPAKLASQDVASFGPLPLTFIPASHALNTPAEFILGAAAQPITFTTSGPIFTLPAAAIPDSTGASSDDIPDDQGVDLPTQTILAATFIGANRRINLFGEDRLSGIANIYDFTGRTPSREGLPTYQNLTYQWLYPGINLTYSGAQGALKSTYIVAPGADPKRIRWHYQPAATVQLRDDGSLAVSLASTHTTPPSLVEHAPIAWQEHFGERIPVQVAYELAADGSVSFALGAYDSTQTLLIDPSITYAYVAPNLSSGQSVKIDAQGMIYVLSQKDGGSWLRKLNPQLPADQQVIYTSDFGSAPFFAEAIDAQGNVVLAGQVAATAQSLSIDGTSQVIRSYPTRDTTGATDRDAFVVAIAPNGTLISGRLVRMGGTRDDFFSAVALDSTGRPILVGSTASIATSTFTVNPLQPSTIADTPCNSASNPIPDANDCMDATIVALSADWLQVLLSSPMGGDARDTGTGIALSTTGDIYVSATSTSTTFLGQPGYHPSGPNCGTSSYPAMRCFDAVLMHLNPLSGAGTAVVGVQYIGGKWSDQANGLAVDGTGAVTIVGSVLTPPTKPAGEPVFPTLNALQPAPISYDGLLGHTDGFVAKYLPSGAGFTPIYSTLLGGGFEDVLYGVAVDATGNAVKASI